jgi:hypothetical protein
MTNVIRCNIRVFAGIAVFIAAAGIQAQTMKPQPVASQSLEAPQNNAPSQLNMPLISAEEGRRYQEHRATTASDVPVQKMLKAEISTAETKPSLEAVTGNALNSPGTQPTLGHPLPSSTKTPLGFPRADFAVEKPSASKQSVQPDTPSSATGLSNTVIK